MFIGIYLDETVKLPKINLKYLWRLEISWE